MSIIPPEHLHEFTGAILVFLTIYASCFAASTRFHVRVNRPFWRKWRLSFTAVFERLMGDVAPASFALITLISLAFAYQLLSPQKAQMAILSVGIVALAMPYVSLMFHLGTVAPLWVLVGGSTGLSLGFVFGGRYESHLALTVLSIAFVLGAVSGYSCMSRLIERQRVTILDPPSLTS